MKEDKLPPPISDCLTDQSLLDYKVFCFDGIPKLLLVVSDRESVVKGDFYTCDWRWLPLKRECRPNKGDIFPRPKELDKVLDMAKTLSKPFPHVRVDFYLENDKIMIGELTFFPSCGLEAFEPKKFDEIMGGYLNLPHSNKG